MEIGFISPKKELEALEQKLEKFAENIEAIITKGLGLEKPNILKGESEYTVFFWNKKNTNQVVKISFLMDGTAKVKLQWQDMSQKKMLSGNKH